MKVISGGGHCCAMSPFLSPAHLTLFEYQGGGRGCSDFYIKRNEVLPQDHSESSVFGSCSRITAGWSQTLGWKPQSGSRTC